LQLLPLVNNFDEIQVCSLYFEDAERMAKLHPKARAVRNVEEAVRRSDVVCLASHSRNPVIDASWIRPGTHISSVGFFPPHGELPQELATKHKLFVENYDAFESAPVGCGELAGLDKSLATELGAVAAGAKSGRDYDNQITVYKAMGIAMEDMVAANLAYNKALLEGGGEQIPW
jgi:ornithine cyclodeaminase/alanine dehydrogenase-like protein (mu-crystallin family)